MSPPDSLENERAHTFREASARSGEPGMSVIIGKDGGTKWRPPPAHPAGHILWLTGLSGAGKSTIAQMLKSRLDAGGQPACVLDGDALRQGINADLGFAETDRAESVRRAGKIAALFADSGFVAITALISPYRSDRGRVRTLRPDRFHEVHVDAPLHVCEARDPKGLYRKARAGAIPRFTGVSDPYEPPETPEIVLDTAALTADECVDRLMGYVREMIARTITTR